MLLYRVQCKKINGRTKGVTVCRCKCDVRAHSEYSELTYAVAALKIFASVCGFGFNFGSNFGLGLDAGFGYGIKGASIIKMYFVFRIVT